MIEKRVFGDLYQEGLEIVERNRQYFVRYDAGAHQVAWREDEITFEEFSLLKINQSFEHQIILALQKRLQLQGVNPYESNWEPGNNFNKTNEN